MSAPFQSKVLNFFNRQVRRWIDQGTIATRRLKQAGIWTLQAVLYCIHALFQTSRSIGAQVGRAIDFLRGWQAAAEGRSLPRTSDTPVQQILQAVSDFSLPQDVRVDPAVLVGSTLQPLTELELPVLESPTHPVLLVRGIASLMGKRSLVLVTVQNQILDILTLEQQESLRQRIIWQVASYGRYLRLQADQHRRSRRLQSVKANFGILSPARLLQPLTSRLPAISGSIQSPRALSFAGAEQMRKLMARFIAPSPAGQTSPSATPSMTSSATQPSALPACPVLCSLPPVLTVIKELEPFLLHPLRWARQQILCWLNSNPVKIQPAPRQTNQSALALQLYHSRQSFPIAAGLPDFGVRSLTTLLKRILLRPLPVFAPLSSLAAIVPAVVVTPVLSLETPSALLTPATLSSPSFSPSLEKELLQGSHPALIPSPSVKPSHPSFPLFLPSALCSLPSTFPTQSRQSALEAQPDFIDTRATVVGYEQTGWTKVIHWVDRIFLWLENVLLALWKLLRLYF